MLRFALRVLLSWHVIGTAARAASEPMASLPLLREEADPSFPLGAFVLVVLLFVAFLAVLVRKKKEGAVPSWLNGWLGPLRQESGQELSLVTSLRLNRTTVVHELQWGGKRLLVACSDNAVAVIAEERSAPIQETKTQGGDA